MTQRQPPLSLDEQEAAELAKLEPRFMLALQAKAAGRIDDAEDELRAIIKLEPRLPEPHMELARLLADTDRVSEGEDHAREALQLLEADGQWTDELPEHVMLGLGHALLAEILRRRADEDDVIFGDPAQFHALVAESRQHFDKAAAIDPSDEYSSYHAFFLGIGEKSPDGLQPDADDDSDEDGADDGPAPE